jgi:hypothetical protein
MNYWIIGIIALLVFYFMSRSGKSTSHLEKMVKKCAKWATTAQQDESPYLAVMHANYASGYLMALKDTATEAEIGKKAGLDFKQFESHIMNVQDMVNKRVIQKCPEFAGNVDLYLSAIAEDN